MKPLSPEEEAQADRLFSEWWEAAIEACESEALHGKGSPEHDRAEQAAAEIWRCFAKLRPTTERPEVGRKA